MGKKGRRVVIWLSGQDQLSTNHAPKMLLYSLLVLMHLFSQSLSREARRNVIHSFLTLSLCFHHSNFNWILSQVPQISCTEKWWLSHHISIWPLLSTGDDCCCSWLCNCRPGLFHRQPGMETHWGQQYIAQVLLTQSNQFSGRESFDGDKSWIILLVLTFKALFYFFTVFEKCQWYHPILNITSPLQTYHLVSTA